MICSNCTTAADYNTISKFALAEAKHQECKGDCGCQHKTGLGWVVKPGVKVPLMQQQSP